MYNNMIIITAIIPYSSSSITINKAGSVVIVLSLGAGGTRPNFECRLCAFPLLLSCG